MRAPDSCTALRTIVVNTGWTSVGELLMTRRISLVAVCCSRASVRSAFLRLQLVEQPRVLDGDGGLVGEGLHQRDVALGERQDLLAIDDDHAQEIASPEHRNRQDGADRIHLGHPVAILGVGQDIEDLHGTPIDRGAVPRRSRARR